MGETFKREALAFFNNGASNPKQPWKRKMYRNLVGSDLSYPGKANMVEQKKPKVRLQRHMTYVIANVNGEWIIYVRQRFTSDHATQIVRVCAISEKMKNTI